VLNDSATSYEQLANAISKCAAALHLAGIRKGDIIATLSSPRPEFILTFLAAARIGAVWLGLNPQYTYDELKFTLSDAKPSALFFIPEMEGLNLTGTVRRLLSDSNIVTVVSFGPSEVDGTLTLDEFLKDGDPDDPEYRVAVQEVESLDPCMIVYTSGTSGKPKGALLSHFGLVHCSRVQNEHWNVDELRVLNNAPINHVGCVGDLSCYALVAGGTLVFIERFRPEQVFAETEKNRVTVWGHVPTVFSLLAEHEMFDKANLSTVELIFWGGAASSLRLIKVLKKITPRLFTSYGLTETTGSVTFTKEGASEEELSNTVGAPDPRYEVGLFRDDDMPTQGNEEGEIRVRGRFVMLGYHNQPKLTREAFTQDGWLKTGDIARKDMDGNFILVGRKSEMFKSGGYNIYPREIENVLELHPCVAISAVIGVSDELYGEVGHAFVQLVAPNTTTPEELVWHCRKLLANFKVPKEISILMELPMLPIGKVDKGALRKVAT
jgi:fatty-acyl-CoA synthase